MTADQSTAFAEIRALAAPHRLRVRPDAEGWPTIPGWLGQIEYHDGHNLAVFTDRPRLHGKLLVILGVRHHQTADREMRALFPPEALEQVAVVIRARRRRVRLMTPDRLAALAAAREKARESCTRATSRASDPVWAAETGSEHHGRRRYGSDARQTVSTQPSRAGATRRMEAEE